MSSLFLISNFSGWKEDKNFQAERDHQRTKFDKKTGQAVTVTGPKDKPESVSFRLSYSYIGLLRSC